jgi:hypothetical protein
VASPPSGPYIRREAKPMTTTVKNRRKQRRYSTLGVDSWVELSVGSSTERLKVLNLSASGLSFLVESAEQVPGLETGAPIDGLVLQIADCRIRGDILVMHVTTRADSRYVCGALFYPATDTDLLKFRSLIVGMEAAGTD